MAGNSSVAESIADTFKEALRQTDDPRAAFDHAVNSNAPFDAQRSCSLVVAFPNSPTPTLLSFNLHNDQRIIEECQDCFLAIGSIPQKYKDLSFHIIEAMAQHFRNEPARFLISIFAIVQSFGIREYLLEKGVGGAFCGLFIGQHSIEWQKDILFILHNEARDPDMKVVTSIVRDHVLVVRSMFDNTTLYLVSSLSCN
jgi:hypothetical protein